MSTTPPQIPVRAPTDEEMRDRIARNTREALTREEDRRQSQRVAAHDESKTSMPPAAIALAAAGVVLLMLCLADLSAAAKAGRSRPVLRSAVFEEGYAVATTADTTGIVAILEGGFGIVALGLAALIVRTGRR